MDALALDFDLGAYLRPKLEALVFDTAENIMVVCKEAMDAILSSEHYLITTDDGTKDGQVRWSIYAKYVNGKYKVVSFEINPTSA